MGSRTDEVERQIAEQRQSIERKLDGLQVRLEEDAEIVRDRVSRRTSATVELFPGGRLVIRQFRRQSVQRVVGILMGTGAAVGAFGFIASKVSSKRKKKRRSPARILGGLALGWAMRRLARTVFNMVKRILMTPPDDRRAKEIRAAARADRP